MSLQANKSFNLFHTNVNGLENKFEKLQNFLNSTNMDLDIVAISETSQRGDIPFSMNVNISGYHKPFSLGSKSARGRVAIFAKENLNVWERDDLNFVCNQFESVWVEIEVKNSKNIVCGCLYRHPNSDINDFTKFVSKSLTKITNEKKECYLLGNFNVDLLKYDSSK